MATSYLTTISSLFAKSLNKNYFPAILNSVIHQRSLLCTNVQQSIADELAQEYGHQVRQSIEDESPIDNPSLETEAPGNIASNTSTLVIKPKAASSQSGPTLINDPVALKFINCMMYDGKKSLSRRIFHEALEMIKKSQIEKHGSNAAQSNIEMDPMKIFHQAIENAKPIIGIQTIKRGGKSYQVPIPLKEQRRYFLAIKWFITIARSGKEHGMSKKLAKEFLNAYNNEGGVIKKKVELHKMAESNRAYAHYRWW